MLDKAVGVELGESESLAAVTYRAAELLDRVVVEDLGYGVGGPRLLHLLQSSPADPEVAGGAAVDAVELFHPDLLDAGWQGCWVGVGNGLGDDGAELRLVVLPLRFGVVDDCRYADREDRHGGDEHQQDLTLRNLLDHQYLTAPSDESATPATANRNPSSAPAGPSRYRSG